MQGVVSGWSAGSAVDADPIMSGNGTVGLIWLLTGLAAAVVGLLLATRRVRKPPSGTVDSPNTGGPVGPSNEPTADLRVLSATKTNQITTDEAGGTRS